MQTVVVKLITPHSFNLLKELELVNAIEVKEESFEDTDIIISEWQKQEVRDRIKTSELHPEHLLNREEA
jgi:hypothetical protein